MIQDGHVPPQAQGLECPADALGSDLVRMKAHQILAIKDDFPLSRLVDAGDEVEDSGLSRSVGANQPSELAWLNLQIVVVDGP